MGATQSLVIHSDAEILGRTPVFVSTRVPFQALIDYLEAGQSLDEFLEDFPTVSRERIGIIWRKQLAIRAKGRDVIAAEAGCQLRETETANQGLFEGQKGGLSPENTFLGTNRSIPQCLSLVRPNFSIYQVRSNLSHRGKGAWSDGEIVRQSLSTLLAVFNDMLSSIAVSYASNPALRADASQEADQ